MSESEFYKSICKATGESNGRLRQIGFQFVQTRRINGDKSCQYGMKYSIRRDPPQEGKVGKK